MDVLNAYPINSASPRFQIVAALNFFEQTLETLVTKLCFLFKRLFVRLEPFSILTSLKIL